MGARVKKRDIPLVCWTGVSQRVLQNTRPGKAEPQLQCRVPFHSEIPQRWVRVELPAGKNKPLLVLWYAFFGTHGAFHGVSTVSSVDMSTVMLLLFSSSTNTWNAVVSRPSSIKASRAGGCKELAGTVLTTDTLTRLVFRSRHCTGSPAGWSIFRWRCSWIAALEMAAALTALQMARPAAAAESGKNFSRRDFILFVVYFAWIDFRRYFILHNYIVTLYSFS